MLMLKFLSLIFVLGTTSASTCYFPSGAIAENNVPCNNGTEFSSCCGSASNCLANGLCLVNDDSDTVEFARGGCTDPTWSSPNCFQHCTQTSDGIIMTNGAAVFECGTVGYASPAGFCCETGPYQKTSCCKTPSLIFQLGAGTPVGMQSIAGVGGSTSTQQQQQQQPTSVSQPTTIVSQNTFTTIVTSMNQIQPTSSSSRTPSSSKSSSVTSNNAPAAAISSTSSHISSSSTTGSSTVTVASNGANGVTAATSSPNVAISEGNGASDTVKIAVGVAVPIAVLLIALLAFLIWNNHRKNKKIQSLQLNMATDRMMPPTSDSGPVMAAYGLVSPVSELGNEKRIETFTKPLPSYPRHEYYKPDPYTRPMHEMGGDGRPHELPQSPPSAARMYELDSSPPVSKFQKRS